MIWNTALTIMHAVGLASCAALLLWVMPTATLFVASRVKRLLPLRAQVSSSPAASNLGTGAPRRPGAAGWTRELKRLWKHLAHFCDSALTH